MVYWDTTAQHIKTKGYPECPFCGKKMFPQDEHGRFACFCNLGFRNLGKKKGFLNNPEIDNLKKTTE